MSPDDPLHGTRFGYRDHKCKCDACKKAIALEHNVYKMRRAANGGNPLTVSKLGAVRRIQALVRIGWTRRGLASLAGYQGDAFGQILYTKRQRVELATHQRIAELYDRLSMTPGPSSSSRIRAEKNGWAPPLAWDNIDDPNERPKDRYRPRAPRRNRGHDEAAVIRLLDGENVPHASRADRDEAMRRWVAAGRSEKVLCEIQKWKAGRYGKRQEAVA